MQINVKVQGQTASIYKINIDKAVKYCKGKIRNKLISNLYLKFKVKNLTQVQNNVKLLLKIIIRKNSAHNYEISSIDQTAHNISDENIHYPTELHAFYETIRVQ